MGIDQSKLSRLEREVDRLRASPSLDLVLTSDAIRKPWKAPFLIFIPVMMIGIGLEMLGRKAPHQQYNHMFQKKVGNRNCIVMFPTNGVGFGHFTRMLAVAKRMKKIDSSLHYILHYDADITFAETIWNCSTSYF